MGRWHWAPVVRDCTQEAAPRSSRGRAQSAEQVEGWFMKQARDLASVATPISVVVSHSRLVALAAGRW